MTTFLSTLDDLWAKGELKDLEVDLDEFVQKNARKFREALQGDRKIRGFTVARKRKDRGELTDSQLLDFCVRMTLRLGSVNPQKDIVEQKKEIENEIWYEGERSSCEVSEDKREEIARAWSMIHAPKWREWRLYKLLYIWEKKRDQYLTEIGAPEKK